MFLSCSICNTHHTHTHTNNTRKHVQWTCAVDMCSGHVQWTCTVTLAKLSPFSLRFTKVLVLRWSFQCFMEGGANFELKGWDVPCSFIVCEVFYRKSQKMSVCIEADRNINCYKSMLMKVGGFPCPFSLPPRFKLLKVGWLPPTASMLLKLIA